MTSEPRKLEEFLRELTRHQRRLRGLVRCLLFDSRDVEDVWQDVNVTLLRKAGEFQPGTDFWAWACSVARYQVLTHCRRLERDRLVLDEELLGLIAEEVEQRGQWQSTGGTRRCSSAWKSCRGRSGSCWNVLEYAIPWRLLNAADDPPRSGDVLAAAWQVHWSDESGRLWRDQMVEIRNRREPPRIMVWERAATWGRVEFR